MPEQVVTLPLVGGIDQSTDPDQLKAPGMKELTNVVVRKKERFQKREGYALIPNPASPTLPATVYNSAGNTSPMPIPAEGINGHKSPSGDKIITIADGQVFEYVGQDGARQYRRVNDVPRAIGDVIPVDTAAGPCLEIESCILKSSAGRLRVTVWTVAQRPAAILADDSAWWDAIDGAGVYLSVQREDSGAFLIAPYRINLPGPIPTYDVRNLRICESYLNEVPGDVGETGCIVMWQQGPYNSAPQLWGMRINANGQIGDVINVTNLLTIGFRGLPPSYRSFDIAPIAASGTGAQYRFALVVCTEDAVAPQIRWYEIRADLSSTWSLVNVPLDVFNPATSSRSWTPRCMRGVTMQYNKGTIDGLYTVTARVGVSDPSASPTPPIDMAIVTFIVTKASGSYAALPNQWGIIRDMNYQTYEDFSQIPGYATVGQKRLFSKNVFNSGFTARVDDQNANIPVGIAPVMTVNMPDGSVQLYRYSESVEFDDTGFNALMTTPEPFVPGNLPTLYLSQWQNLQSARYSHQYPANLVFDVNISSTAVYSRGAQVAGLTYNVCGPSNRFTGAAIGYYSSVDLTVVSAGVPQVTAAIVDVCLDRGVDASSLGAIVSPSLLTNGTYNAVQLVVGGNSTASATVTVAAGTISSIVITQSGYGMPAGAAIPVNIASGAMYVNSPAISAVTTCATDVYAAFVVMVNGGVYDNTAVPFLHLRSGTATFAAGTGTPVLPAPTAYTSTAYMVDWSSITNVNTYSFRDGADTMSLPSNPSFALVPQSCVQRWSSVIVDTSPLAPYAIVGITSVGANQFTSSSGEPPISIAEVHSTNNYFEAYRWDSSLIGETLLRSRVGVVPTIQSYLVSALAGPWRMIGDMTVIRRPSIPTVTDPYYCRVVTAITPAGDNQQRSQFLVYIGDVTNSGSVYPPSFDQGTSSLNWQYLNNKGMFVESLNAPRVLTVPLNSCRLFTQEATGAIGSDVDPVTRTVSVTGGLLRDGSSENTCQVGAVSYNFTGEAWRQMLRYADYTFINGGVMSSFDGSSCGEACIMMWPQRDLCRISSDRTPSLSNTSEQYYADSIKLNLQSCIFPVSVTASSVSSDAGEIGMAALANVTRPYFAYEAGLSPAIPPARWSSAGTWGNIGTSFGGDPLKDYQSISVDGRISAYSMNSAVSGDSNPGGQKAVTFYGKYGKYAKYGSTVYWVPRNVEGNLNSNEMSQKGCFFDSIDTSSDMFMRWVYEVSDGTGRMHRSAASVPSRYAILSLLHKSTKADTVVSAAEFRYGFFAPRVELTNRLRTGADDNKRVTLQAYTTAEPYGSVFYRMPFSNWLTPATSFISERNSGRQLCAYEADRYMQSNPYGFVTNNLKCFNGQSGDYLGILGMPFLYTTGGEVPNACPPSVRCMTIHQNRLVVGGADDATVIWLSKEVTEQDAPTFSDLLTVRIADGGAVTGLGSLSRALVVFKNSQIHVLTGDMPDNTVSGSMSKGLLSSTLGEPYRLVDGLGCVSPRSVVTTPAGIFFKSARTLELMGQNLAVSPIGLRVMDVLEEYSNVVSAIHKAVDSEVIFCLQKASVLEGTNQDESGKQYVLLVYNYAEDIWSKHTCDGFGVGSASLGELNDQTLQAVGGRTYVTSDTRFYDTTPSGNQWVTMSGETASIALHQQQGFQRVKRIVLMGDPTPSVPAASTYQPHAMTVTVSTDWDSTQTAAWTSDQVQAVLAKQGREFFGVHVRDQKCQKVSIRFEDSPPTGGAITTGYGVAFSNIALTVGLKSGLNKRMTQDAEH